MFENLMVLNSGEDLTGVLVHYTFANPSQPSGTVFETISGQLVNTTIQKSLVNSIDGVSPVGQFNASESLSFTLPEEIGTGPFTMELWARMAAADIGGTHMAVSNMANASGVVNNVAGRLSLGVSASNIYSPTGYGTSNATTTKFPADQPNHLCFMRDEEKRSHIFLNGVRINNFSHTASVTVRSFCLGAYISGTRRFFKGQIAEMAISKKARYAVSGFTPKYPLFG